jgi:hypothetical protein
MKSYHNQNFLVKEGKLYNSADNFTISTRNEFGPINNYTYTVHNHYIKDDIHRYEYINVPFILTKNKYFKNFLNEIIPPMLEVNDDYVKNVFVVKQEVTPISPYYVDTLEYDDSNILVGCFSLPDSVKTDVEIFFDTKEQQWFLR